LPISALFNTLYSQEITDIWGYAVRRLRLCRLLTTHGRVKLPTTARSFPFLGGLLPTLVLLSCPFVSSSSLVFSLLIHLSFFSPDYPHVVQQRLEQRLLAHLVLLPFDNKVVHTVSRELSTPILRSISGQTRLKPARPGSLIDVIPPSVREPNCLYRISL
jgi:hypothetical protein